MRTPTAVFALLAFALPATAGPIDSWQYRTTLRTDQAPGAGPVWWPGETAYQLGSAPEFGVVTSSVPFWEQASPAYPSANFALVHPGTFTPYIAGGPLFPDVSGGGRYFLDFEIRDAEGRVGVVSFSGNFSAGWWGGHGYTYPNSEAASSVRLGYTRYDVYLHFGFGGPYYIQDADGNWSQGWQYAADPVPYQNGGYWSEFSGTFYAEIVPTGTPEPGTLALAAIGLCGLLGARRMRRSTT